MTLQLLGKTYQVTLVESVFVGWYRSDESGLEWWRTVRTYRWLGETFRTESRHRTRSEAMLVVRRALYGRES